jgi:hypothetical protein
MQLDFLEAADGLSLTKTFRLNNGEIETEPYPFVKYVNSYHETVESIDELSEAVQRHAKLNRCLLKGLLSEPLTNSRRAGKTSPDQPTSWILLDLDFHEGWSSVDAFLADLNPEWADVSYVFQHSASAGIKCSSGLRGHLWLMLDEPMQPAVLKQWLKERNLQLDALRPSFELSVNGMSLRWPLDITTCQNDKLIYIAPPVVEGIDDPLEGERFVVRHKGKELAPAPKPTLIQATVDHQEQEVINQLRKDAGLPKRTPKMKESGTLEILTNPERGTVTGVKKGRGFVYLNLNGGDSWGYYFPENKPELLYNFKGEPVVRLRDVAPDFYHDYIQQLHQERFGDLRPYVFRDPNKDTYFNVLYSPSKDSVEMMRPAASKDRLSDFMQQFAQSLPEPVEDWRVEFDPTTTKIIDPAGKWINLFRPSAYIKHIGKVTPVDHIPPTIDKLIDSICADDQEAKAHFLNWLARMFQTRKRNETAWIFHGVQGTGKGLLLNKVLRPMFGPEHVTEWTTQNFEEQYNQALEQTCLLWLDEFQVRNAKQAQTVMSKLKNYITENEITIRAMRANSTQVTNHLNVIIATNYPDPVQLSEHDRRFNVAPPQERALKISEQEVDALDDEVAVFASFLWNFKVDDDQGRRILQNEAREQMITASQTSGERFFSALRSGDLNWFMSYLRAEMPLNDTLYYTQFQKAVLDWCQQCMARTNPEAPIIVTRDDLINIYSYIIGGGMTPAKFSRMCAVHRLRLYRVTYRKKTVQGIRLQMQGDEERMREVIDNAQQPNLQAVS